LAEELAAPPLTCPQAAAETHLGSGPLSSAAVAQSLSVLLPEHAIVVDEAATFGHAFYPGTRHAAPHDWLQNTGGAIGHGLPMALGAAVAAPGRRVVALQADGSAMYTPQALWTMARERLDVTVVILANRKYAILQLELANVGATAGATAMNMLDLGNPDLDWVQIATGMGVEAARADTMERFNELFAMANRRPGPFLIELVV
jgi:acetolactate synthase-1/2/3 large subunit